MKIIMNLTLGFLLLLSYLLKNVRSESINQVDQGLEKLTHSIQIDDTEHLESIRKLNFSIIDF